MGIRTCSLEDCDVKHLSLGYCRVHYNHFKAYGDPLKTGWGTPSERFWKKVDTSGDCWLWSGEVGKDGYGRFWMDQRHNMAHRVAYQLVIGPIPDGKFLDHTCHNTICVKPDHLRIVTPKQNSEHRTGAMSNSATGILGVSWCGTKKRYRATVRHTGVDHHAGYHLSVEDAASAIVAKRNELFTHNDNDRAA